MGDEKSLTEAIFFPLQIESLFFTLVSSAFCFLQSLQDRVTDVNEVEGNGKADLTEGKK